MVHRELTGSRRAFLVVGAIGCALLLGLGGCAATNFWRSSLLTQPRLDYPGLGFDRWEHAVPMRLADEASAPVSVIASEVADALLGRDPNVQTWGMPQSGHGEPGRGFGAKVEAVIPVAALSPSAVAARSVVWADVKPIGEYVVLVKDARGARTGFAIRRVYATRTWEYSENNEEVRGSLDAMARDGEIQFGGQDQLTIVPYQGRHSEGIWLAHHTDGASWVTPLWFPIVGTPRVLGQRLSGTTKYPLTVLLAPVTYD